MRTPNIIIRGAFALSLLSPSGILFAQDPSQAPAPTGAPQTAPTTNGGWRRLSDPTANQQASQDPSAQPQSTEAGQQPQGPPPDAQGQGNYPPNYPQQQGNYPPQGYPQQGNYPPPGYPQQGNYPPQGYPQQGNYPPQGNYPQNQNNQPAPPPVPAHLTIKAGTYVTARINQTLSSDRNQPGDAFTATLVQPVVIDGVVVAQRGQLISGRVAEAQKAGRVEGVSKLGVQLTELTLVDGQQMPIQSQMLNRTGPTSVGRDVGAIAGTTALGAAVGAAADWGRGAAIGAGAGLIASTVGVLLTRGHPTVIYPETVLTFRVEAPVEISTDHAPDAFRYVNPNDYERPPSYQGMGRPGLGPYGYAGPGYAGAPGYAPYYYGYAAPYPYWGPGLGFYFGPGFYYGRGFYGRGFGGGFYRGGRR